eukprot:749020-Hanusia_phi.AAC.1
MSEERQGRTMRKEEELLCGRYGDVTPTTYGGRAVSALTNVAGLLLVAALTSSLSHVLIYSDAEMSAMCLFEREKAAARLLHLAALLIQSWWARRKARRGLGRGGDTGWRGCWRRGEASKAAGNGRWLEFEQAKEKSLRELNACLGPSMKVDLLYSRMKRLTTSSLSLRLKLSPSSAASFRQPPPDPEAEEELHKTVKAIQRRRSLVLLPRQRRSSSVYQSLREDRIDNFFEVVEAVRSRYFLSK